MVSEFGLRGLGQFLRIIHSVRCSMEVIAMPRRATGLPLFLVFLGCLVLLAVGCSTHQAQNTRLFNQWNAKCKEAADLLETVKDVPSAKAAAPQIAAAMREIQKIDAQLEKSYDPEDVDFHDTSRVTKQVAEGIGQMQRLMVESLRVGKDPAMRDALGEAWQLLPAAAMMEAGVEFPPIE